MIESENGKTYFPKPYLTTSWTPVSRSCPCLLPLLRPLSRYKYNALHETVSVPPGLPGGKGGSPGVTAAATTRRTNTIRYQVIQAGQVSFIYAPSTSGRNQALQAGTINFWAQLSSGKLQQFQASPIKFWHPQKTSDRPIHLRQDSEIQE